MRLKSSDRIGSYEITRAEGDRALLVKRAEAVRPIVMSPSLPFVYGPARVAHSHAWC